MTGNMRKLLQNLVVAISRRSAFVAPAVDYTSRCHSTSIPRFFSTPVSTQNVEEDYRFNTLVKKMEDLKIRSEYVIKCVNESPELLNYHPGQWESCFLSLRHQGFTKEDFLNMISRCPPLLKRKKEDLDNTLQAWRLAQIKDKDIFSLLRLWPHILQLSDQATSDRLLELKTLGSWKTVIAVLKNCPVLLFEDLDNLDEKLNYLEIVMNIEKAKIFKTAALSRSILFLKTRHVCLERCGKYVRPREKDDSNTPNCNPSLKLITDTDDAYFARKVAGLTLEEYEVFQKLYEEEFEEEKDAEYESGSDSE